MNKNIFSFIVLLTIFFLTFSYIDNKYKGSYIKIENKTDLVLENISIGSNSFKNIITIAKIGPKTTKEYEVTLNNFNNKTNIKITYLANDNKPIVDELTGTFNYKDKIQKKFTIFSIDENGILDIKENNYGLIH